MNIVIIGAGEVGSTIAESLSGSHDITVVDIDPKRVDELTYDLDVLAMQGDTTDSEALREAGAADADLFIASTDIDETNIVACGTAKALGSPFTTARVKRPQFLDTWQQGEGVFGVDFIVCTDLSTAQVIADVIRLPTARDVDTFANGTIQMAEFNVPPDSPITDRTVAESDTFETLTFAAIIRDDEFIIPSGQTVIEADDDLIGHQERIVAVDAPANHRLLEDVLRMLGVLLDDDCELLNRIDDDQAVPVLGQKRAKCLADTMILLEYVAVLEQL